MVKKELAEKLNLCVYSQEQTMCQQKVPFWYKNCRININTQFEAIKGPYLASLVVQNKDNSTNDIVKIEVWFWMQQADSSAIDWKLKRLVAMYYKFSNFYPPSIFFSLF